MREVILSDTTCLITLTRMGELELLRKFGFRFSSQLEQTILKMANE